MNIFYLDQDPILAAQAQCDAHVVKMILESAQMLCTALHAVLEARGGGGDPVPYRPTHRNHPSAVWVRQDALNAMWLTDHARALGDEFTYRYGGVHKSVDVVNAVWPRLRKLMPFDRFTEPPQAMPDEFKADNPVLAYRAYYRAKKASGMKWNYTKRDEPRWMGVRLRERVAPMTIGVAA